MKIEVKEQAIWALGNIAGDYPRCRDAVLQANALMPLLNLLNEAKKLSLIRNATWTLSNFCRGKQPQPKWEVISQALPTLAKLVDSVDEEVIIDSCWAVSYLSDGPNDKIQAVIEAGIPRKLVELLGHASTGVQTPALRSIGNLVTGDDIQTQVIINCGALPALLSLLSSPKESIKKEAYRYSIKHYCWKYSTNTIDNDANFEPPLINLLSNGDIKTREKRSLLGNFKCHVWCFK